MLKRFIKSRKGTAEVIGTILLIVILLFLFTNVYLWHDAATKDMDELHVKQMSAGMGIVFNSTQVTVTATASEVTLSMLWIDTSSSHVYVNLTLLNVQVAPGAANAVTFTFNGGNPISDGNGGFYVLSSYNKQSNIITVQYSLPQDPKFTIVNELGIAVST